jgi:O-antigen/teichoic acid export membrane protein
VFSNRVLGVDTLCVVIPKVTGGVATIFLHLYAIRWLDPAAYGAFGLCLTCVVMFESFVGSALDLGLLREAPLIRASGALGLSSLERSAIVIKLGMGCVLLIIAVLLGDWFNAVVFRQPDGGRIFASLVIAGTSVLLVRSVQVSFQLSHRFWFYGAADLAHTLLRAILVGGLIFAGSSSAVSLMGAYAVAALVVTAGFGVLLLKNVWCAPWLNFVECKKLVKYCSSVLAVGGLGTAISFGDIFALAVFSTPEQVGIYKAAQTIAFLPELLGMYLAQVFSPRIAAYCQQRIFYRFFVKLQGGLFIAGIMILVVGLLLTKPVISVLFPDRYGSSIEIIMILLPAGIAGLISFPVVVNFLVFFSLRQLFIVDCIMAPFVIVAYYYAAREGGAPAVAWVTSVSRLAKTIILHLIATRIARRMELQTLPDQSMDRRAYETA